MDITVDRLIKHHTNAVLGRVAAYLNGRFPGQITAEVAEEMMRVANETKTPTLSSNGEAARAQKRV